MIRCTGGWPASHRSALATLWPLPMGVSLQVNPPSFSLSPIGLTLWNQAVWTNLGRSADQCGRSWRWEQVQSAEVRDSAVHLNGEEILRFPLRQSAAAFAELIESARVAPKAEREQLVIRFLDASLDLVAISERIDAAIYEANALRWLGALQLALMFLVAPVVLSNLGGSKVLSALALTILIPVLFSVSLFVRNHRRTFPEERWARVETAFIMCVSWPMASRAATILNRHRLQGFHPVAIALALKDAKNSREFVARTLRDLAHPLREEELSADALEITDWYLEWYRRRLPVLAAQHGFRELSPTAAVPRSSDDEFYCPRCLAAYTRRITECADCPGVELQTLQSHQSEGA
ncbi:MAG: hypothetical protein GY906_03055 [bacterium]|nr:hypothetical protein [bacterium]